MKKYILTIYMVLAVSVTGFSQTNVFPASGNMGVGTTSPSSLIHVSSLTASEITVEGDGRGFTNADIVLKANNAVNYRGLGVFMYDKGAQNEWFAGRPYAGSDQWVIFRNTGLSDHSTSSAGIRNGAGEETGAVALFSVKASGNVGIGTTTPADKLEVNGSIRSREVKVEASPWPDFVFEDGYALKSLDEVEQFITEQGHLPEVPTAQDVSENGISLGEMNAKLLQKIEELTLYSISQQHQLDSNADEIERLKKENEEFRSISDRLKSIERQLSTVERSTEK